MPNKPTFTEALKFWTKLGFISFGGPAGQVAIMHEVLVDKKKWISNSKFMHALNYCMILPGPEAQQLATYIGWMLHGTWGGLAAGLLFILPSLFILLVLSIIYVAFGNLPWIYALFAGLKPAVIAIVILALIKIAKKSLLSPFHYCVAVAAFTGIFFFNIPFPYLIAGTIIIAAIVRKFFPKFFAVPAGKASSAAENEDDYYINNKTIIPSTGFNPLRFWKKVIVAAIIWVIPFGAFFLLSTDVLFWKKITLFFTQAAFVTFGGAYAVLPYVAQVSVEKFKWLSSLQMIDGLALGETTPGPLIMVLAFVGFMAGFNHFGSSVAMGALGMLTTTFYTFLPCFLFIFAGAPIIERTQENKTIKEILAIVTAAVVGVILNLTIYLGKAVIFPKELSFSAMDYPTLAWTIISFVAMYRFKIGMIPWIAISAAFGLVNYVLFK
ncbi:MAG TPA: chromate efflux transporter [Ferruginibacter sp.]|nr:chromate efflux transporter [Ferruginibacter sp.]HMP21619.1 chromate efflux transporter [Ferruginibacter sp.]